MSESEKAFRPQSCQPIVVCFLKSSFLFLIRKMIFALQLFHSVHTNYLQLALFSLLLPSVLRYLFGLLPAYALTVLPGLLDLHSFMGFFMRKYCWHIV